ncbi:MAG: glycosyltransferase family 4 protein, partial [Gemmatimonadales bacterium]
RRVDGVIAGSAGAAEEARRLGYRGPLAVIPQLGVEVADVPVRAAGRGGPLRVAFAGRLTSEKGVDVLLSAVAGMEAPAHLRILGDGPERGRLERLTRELGVADRVQFLGAWPHERVASLWPETDVLVLPSRSTPRWKEQLGHVLIEAMAHRVAVVGSTCGAIPDVIGEAGLVFPEGESAALVAHLDLLALDPEARTRCATAGRERVTAEYTNARIAARTRAFHAEVLARR